MAKVDEDEIEPAATIIAEAFPFCDHDAERYYSCKQKAFQGNTESWLWVTPYDPEVRCKVEKAKMVWCMMGEICPDHFAVVATCMKGMIPGENGETKITRECKKNWTEFNRCLVRLTETKKEIIPYEFSDKKETLKFGDKEQPV